MKPPDNTTRLSRRLKKKEDRGEPDTGILLAGEVEDKVDVCCNPLMKYFLRLRQAEKCVHVSCTVE